LRRSEQYVYDIRTITLDLDDTLWDIAPVIRRAETRLRNWLEERYPRIVEMHQPEDIVELRAQVVAEFQDRSHDLTFIRCEVLARMGIAAGYGDDFVDEAFDVFDKERNTVELFPEVRPALESLASRFTLVAVTNGNARLERIGIDHLAGLRAVWLNRNAHDWPGGLEPPERIVSNLRQLDELLDSNE
jgi:putative hydrolase of the HAD superfamily